MQRNLIVTADGSHTVVFPENNTTYHSMHGAIQESMHVFVNAGYDYRLMGKKPGQMNILEMGFGTGLNALLTLMQAEKTGQKIYYASIELFPLSIAEARPLNYCALTGRPDLQVVFDIMHACEWENPQMITPFFELQKIKHPLLSLNTDITFDVIYYDAFDPGTQPELWTKEIFAKLYSLMNQDGILVTYSSKGDVRRALQSAGFSVEKIPGPTGKREITRAKK